MTLVKIAILDDYADLALKLVDWAEIADQAEVAVFNTHVPEDEIALALGSFDVICTVRERCKLGAAEIATLPNLKMIVVTDAHVTTIDNAAATARGVLICEGKAPDGMAAAPSSTPEFAWGLLLSTLRHIPEESQRLREGLWQHSLGHALAGRTLGILGLGRIGRRMAHFAQAFDMQVLAWSQNLTDEFARKAGAKRVEKNELFRNSDIVTVHYVLSRRSRGLVGAAELAAMKPNAYLINTSRGPIVDEAALIDALQKGRIAGAGLDVFDTEPLPRDHPFRRLANVTMTPHLGFVTETAMRRFHAGAASAVAAYLRGQPINVLNAPDTSKSN
jgi:phosphoglycerate dehydrogenase-like enzyme